MLIIYLAVLMTGMYWAYKMLAPEMRKPSPSKETRDLSSTKLVQDDRPGIRIEKMETLLAEKNKNILLLQTELKAFYAQIRDFDKIKTLLEEEIHRLKEQNRIFRSELGMPADQPKENSTT